MELKPCPFCGEDGIISHGTLANPSYPVCSNKLCPAGKSGRHFDFERWNSRPIEDALRAEVAGLRDELADALDLKAGQGPTALGRAIAEVERLRMDLGLFRSENDDLRVENERLRKVCQQFFALFPPGSPDAKARGCICQPLDREQNLPAYMHTRYHNCPLHGSMPQKDGDA